MVSRFCFYCGKPLSRQQATQDHVRPRSKGGSDSKKNKVDCCRTCNEEKGCLTLEEFRAVHAFREGVPVTQFRFPGEIENYGGRVHPASEAANPKKQERAKRQKHSKRIGKRRLPTQHQPETPSNFELTLEIER